MTALLKIVSSFESPANVSLLLAVVWVIEERFSVASSAAMLIGQYAETKTSELEHKDLIEDILKKTSGSANVKYLIETFNSHSGHNDYNSLTTNLSDEEYFYRSSGKKQIGVWFIDGLESFKHLESDLMNERYHYKRNGYFCIVYTGLEKDVFNKMQSIFRRLFKLYVINVNMFLKVGRLTRVYTYMPFTPTKCHNAEPMPHGIIGAITGYKFNKRDFFLKKLSNMWGCKLRITTWNEPPFIVFEKEKVKGIEGLLLEELAARKNFTIHLKKPPKEDQDYTYANQTETGFMKMLINKETNITIVGLMYDKDRLKVAEAAYTYMNVPLVLAIPRGRSMSPWERILRPFKYIIWSCFSSSVLFGILVIFSLKLFFKPYVHRFVFGNGIRTPFTNLWNVLYGGPIHGSLPGRNFSRYLLAVWILYTFVLRSAYIGELYILLQDSRARSYLKTVSEVLKKNFTIYSYPILEPLLVDVSIPSRNIHYIDSSHHKLPILLENIRNENSKIVVTILGPIIRAYNKQKENQAHQINVLPETLLMAPITFYMPKHSYLTFEFDDMLLKIMSAGLVEKYMDFYMGQNTLWVKTEQQEPLKLSLWLLFGLFSVYLSLLFLCFLVFLFEVRSRRSKIISRIIEFFNY